jgi:hypothetical protein
MDTTTKLWRLIFSLFRLLSTLIALVIVIGGIVVYASEPLSLLIPQDTLVAVIVGGSLTALFSFVSFLVIGVKKRTDGARGARVRWIIVDAILMAFLAAIFIIASLRSIRQSATISTSTKKRFSSFWGKASPTMLILIQAEGQCCGFEGYTDRVLEPCKKYSEAVGCWSVLKDEYAYYLHLLTPALIVLASLCTAASLTAFILFIMRLRTSRNEKSEGGNGLYYETDESFKINRSQPFDAWHKAVFSA